MDSSCRWSWQLHSKSIHNQNPTTRLTGKQSAVALHNQVDNFTKLVLALSKKLIETNDKPTTLRIVWEFQTKIELYIRILENSFKNVENNQKVGNGETSVNEHKSLRKLVEGLQQKVETNSQLIHRMTVELGIRPWLSYIF